MYAARCVLMVAGSGARCGLKGSGAEDGIRTRDPNLGKVVLYH